jgi:pimeloyl-ACP methyl ester carboxylesterase
MQEGLDAVQARELINRLRDEGVDVSACSAPMLARQLSQPALCVHSADDRVVGIADAEAASAAWRGLRLLRVDGLGHRRLLQDPQVVAAVTELVARSAEPVGANGGLVSIAA